MNAKLITVSKTRMLVAIQFSKIGYGYPSLFIEEIPDVSYVKVDLTIGAAFKMPVKNWLAWLDGAEEADARSTLEDADIDYDVVYEIAQKIEAR